MFPGVYRKVGKPFILFNLDAIALSLVSLVFVVQNHLDLISL